MVGYYSDNYLKQLLEESLRVFGFIQWMMTYATKRHCYPIKLYTCKKNPLETDLTGVCIIPR